jgi:hypothetical protein
MQRGAVHTKNKPHPCAAFAGHGSAAECPNQGFTIYPWDIGRCGRLEDLGKRCTLFAVPGFIIALAQGHVPLARNPSLLLKTCTRDDGAVEAGSTINVFNEKLAEAVVKVHVALGADSP